ncbi:MAG: hypothetical protein CXT73_05210 [Methanobacteriota archaeon]|nr:MAG: hypothetical protein CXT73_05210 [Euryarchaeota archaeon]
MSLKKRFEELEPKYPVISDVWIKIIDSRFSIIESTCKQAEEMLIHIKYEDESLLKYIDDRKLMLMLYLIKMKQHLNNT